MLDKNHSPAIIERHELHQISTTTTPTQQNVRQPMCNTTSKCRKAIQMHINRVSLQSLL